MGKPIAVALATLLLAAVAAGPASAHPPDHDHTHHSETGPSSAAEVGAKLSNPLADIWALFTEFDFVFNDGDVNRGDPKFSSQMVFQPILPIPLYGEGSEEWKLIARPTVPVIWSAPRPEGLNKFNYDTGLGDTLLPLLVAPPVGDNWILGAGPTFTLPTSTEDAFGRQQWAMGPAGVIGYKTKDFTVGVFPQYFWGIGGRGDRHGKANANYMSLLYFGFLNLPNAWQVGFNPSITYDNKASGGNKWNVPVGLVAAKTIKLGDRHVKFQLGAEYSVLSQDDFGKRALFKLNIIPVIPSLIKNPIFGGG